MPKQNIITINDGKPTPVAHAFQPLQAFSGVAEWAEPSSDGSLTKRNQLKFLQKLPGKNRTTVSESAELVLPHVISETAGGVTRDVIHSNVRVVVTVVSSPEVPKQLVKDARVLMMNLLNNADVVSAMDDRVGFN